MKKFLKRFAIIFSILLVGLLALAIALGAIFENKIEKLILTEINKQLATELTVENFDLSVLSVLPNAAADLEGVKLMDNKGEVLLRADKASLRFGLFSLLSSNVKVKSVVVSDGELNILIDEAGKGNFDIVKSGEASAADAPKENSGGMAISLESARLKNMEVNFADRQTGNIVATNVGDATFSGEFSSEAFSLDSKASLQSRFIENAELRYLIDKKMKYEAKVLVNLKEQVYELQKVRLDLESNVFRAEGSVELQENGPYFDLYLNSEETSLGAVFKLLPEEYLQQLGDFNSTGNFRISAVIKGLSSARTNPEIEADLKMKDGKITSPRMEGALKDVSFEAKYSNGRLQKNESSSFEINDFKAYFNRELFEASLRLDNFDQPEIDFELDGVLPMSSIYGLLNNPKITDGRGEIEIKALKLKGRYEDMIRSSQIDKITTSGIIVFDDASLTINGEKMLLDRGQLEIDGNRLAVEDLRIEGAGSDMLFRGTAFNLIPVLFADSLNTQRAELEFQAELISDKMDIGRLMQLSAVAPTAKKADEAVVDSLQTEQIKKREQFTSLLKGAFNADIKEFNYRKIQGVNFEGKLNLDNNELAILGATRAMGGSFELDGRFYFEEKPRLHAKVSGGGVDAKEFFRQGENFGQQVLTHKHLEGLLHTKMAIYAYWNEEGDFLMDDLRILAAVGVEEGELKNFEMMDNFSSFVNINDLRHIKFTNLENFMEIRKQRLYIPVMFIQSNALNLTLNGEHTFDNVMRYNLKVNAGQVLAQKFKSHDPALKPVKARKKGFFNLYYTISGPADNYEFKANKREIKDEFQLSDIRRQEIQTALEKEFGIIELVREPEDWRDIPEYDYGSEKEEDVFLEWEQEGGKKKQEGEKKSG